MPRLYRDWLPAPSTILLGAVVLPLAVVVVDLLGPDLVAGSLPLALATYADLSGVYGSVVLTAALVLLYREQTRIQERQEQWMEAEHVPDVSVHRWEVTRNRVDLELSNLGTGVAQNLQLRIELETTDETGISRATFAAALSRESSSARVLRPREDGAVETSGFFEATDAEGTVGSGDMTIEQVVSPWLNSEDAPIELVVVVEYDYIRRRSDTRRVFSCRVDPSEAGTIEDILLSESHRVGDESEIVPVNLR
ncbi:hypothetical protein RYH80_00465 [Halobaculum sp. MBLA0147]|uniref:hypothetical protein n=1 Tax=Halobaculum sp. MBLA0147 TaxID=3079934 RepID=UPI0035235400